MRKQLDSGLALNMLIADCHCSCTGLRLMADWPVPEGLEGGTGLLRVQATWARASNSACPQYQAARARPGLWPARRAPRSQPGLTHFSLDPVMTLLDLVEHDGLTLEQALTQVRDGRTEIRPHEGLLRWGAHGAARYLSAGSAVGAGSGWAAVPVSRPWVMQVKPPDGGTIYELCAWGRRYESADGEERELRLPRVKSVKDRAVDLGEAAAAAMVLAYGAVALNQSRSGKPHNLREAQPVRSIRVVEVGCEDGSWQEMFSGSPQKARRYYDEHAKARLSAVTAGGEYRPGDDCAGCKLAGTCPALPSRPGMLGIIGTGPVRTWSVTNGRHYEACPAQDYLERLHLPPGPRTEPNSAVRRGQAVHAWLASRHERPGAAPCSAEDVPDSPDAWLAGGWEVTGEEARLGVQMIGDHSLTCALEDLPPGAAVLPEHRLMVYDPDARVLVIAKADLLYEADGAWTLRETKTTRRVSEGSLLDRYPQTALGILLLAAGVPGGSRGSNRVQLERLTPAGPLLDELDPADADVHAEALRVIGDMVGRWRNDGTAVTVPGPACRDCEASRWCPDAAAEAQEEGDFDD